MRQARALPRWPVLLTLVASVLGVHLWLLAGGRAFVSVPDIRLDAPADIRPATAPDDPDTNGEPAAPQPERLATVSVSAVRWIAPPPPPAPRAKPVPDVAPVPSQPTPRPRPASTDAAPARADEIPAALPAPAMEWPAVDATDAQTPPPAEAPAPEVAQDAATDVAPEVTTSAPAPASDTLLATNGPDTASASNPPPVEDTQVAKAGVTVPRTPATTDRSLPPAQPPASVELGYDVRGKTKGLSYSANAQLRWKVDGSNYTAELEISAFLVGSRTQTSQGSLGPQGLIPLRFGDRRRGNEKAAHFDQAQQRIRFSNNAPDAALLPGAQDRLSVFLQLAALLQARPQAYPEGTPLSVQVASTGGAEIWRFQVGPMQTLELPAGTVSARRLLRAPRRDYDSTVEVWLAPSLQHLPVRIRVTEHDGGVADQVLQQLPPLPPISQPAQPVQPLY